MDILSVLLSIVLQPEAVLLSVNDISSICPMCESLIRVPSSSHMVSDSSALRSRIMSLSVYPPMLPPIPMLSVVWLVSVVVRFGSCSRPIVDWRKFKFVKSAEVISELFIRSVFMEEQMEDGGEVSCRKDLCIFVVTRPPISSWSIAGAPATAPVPTPLSFPAPFWLWKIRYFNIQISCNCLFVLTKSRFRRFGRVKVFELFWRLS